jgi:ABC-type transport system involved in multi-copper enzyme maturation permease subunit
LLGPIFNREWLTAPRRPRHYLARAAYLGLLWVVGLTAWQVTVGWSQTATLGDNARFGTLVFQVLTKWVQLPLLIFFPALSAASAVSQEKDRRTFVLLLLTDLRSYEIVLGKLFGSLLPIAVLLVGMVPVLCLSLLLGGVAPHQVALATLVLAATALAAGSAGNLIALSREKTFQSLALTVLSLILYYGLVQALALLPGAASGLSGAASAAVGWDVETWQQWLDPFRAMDSVLDPSPSMAGAVAPAFGYAVAMVLASAAMAARGVWRLRVWNPSGEPVMQREAPDAGEATDRTSVHAAPGAARPVWTNPILWREIATRAYGRRPLLVKLTYFLVLALVCGYALGPLATATDGASATPVAPGLVLTGVVILSLILLSAQAVTAVTSERDLGALDLLLVTDLTPREFVFGKLGGILYNAKEYLLPPFVLAGLYAALGLLATPPAGRPELLAYKNFEAVVCVVAALVVLTAFATVLGLHVALRAENSRLAIVNTLATMFFLSAGTLLCIQLIKINTRQFEYQWLSFVLFIGAGILGLWWVLSADRPSTALTVASWACPLGVFYTVVNIEVGRPGSQESTDPLIPFLVTGSAFGFAVAAMLVPLLGEFDVTLGRTSGGGD